MTDGLPRHKPEFELPIVMLDPMVYTALSKHGENTGRSVTEMLQAAIIDFAEKENIDLASKK